MNYLKERDGDLFSNADLKQLIVPLLIEQLLAIAVGMADSIMVSSVGEAAVSGVSLVDQIMVLLINAFAVTGDRRCSSRRTVFWDRIEKRRPVNRQLRWYGLLLYVQSVLRYLYI